jgi:hypothetical protein
MAPDGATLAHTFRIGRDDSNYLFCGRLALASICIISIEAAQGTPDQVPVADTCGISAAPGKVK